MDKEISMAFGDIYNQMNDLGYRVDQMMQILNAQRKEEIEAITPYIDTKTAYIGDTEITFYDTPSGNLTVFFDKPYTVERLADRITVSFEELEEVTEVTISIL